MLRVLVVEPDASARHATMALVRSLEPAVQVDGVAELEQIRPAIERLQLELLIVDPAAYGPRGEQLLRVFRAAHPATRLLVLTAGSARGSVRRLPADLVVDKRLAPSRLREVIRAVLVDPPVHANPRA